MTKSIWLLPVECSLLQTDRTDAEIPALRSLQRVLEICLTGSAEESLIRMLLEEIAATLSCDQAVIHQAAPNWPEFRSFHRRGAGKAQEPLPRSFLSDVMDKSGGGCLPADGNGPNYLAVQLTENLVLLLNRARDSFTSDQLNYAVAVGQYLGTSLVNVNRRLEEQLEQQRLQALVRIAEQLVDERETVSLLEHIAEQATKLMQCERASIFLWDQSRKELVGRPALGLPNGELRIPDNAGVVGKVVQSGQLIQVNDVRSSSFWNPQVDQASGFQTRNLLCIPLNDSDGKRVGAFEVMNKTTGVFSPADIETLQALGRQTVTALRNVQERETLMRSNAEFEDQARLACRMVGESTKIRALRGELERLATTELPVLVLGESGTGKDVVARSIHFASHRSMQPFIPINCAAIAESLLESELFGHEKGAFTGADNTRAGKFEAANGGTLFLDEIGELSAGGQAKLLRVLEEKVVYRVGGSEAIPVDTRIVAATNRDLGEEVQKKKFREDLFYRLSVVTLQLPPLREREDDSLLLAEHFLQHFCKQAGRKVLKFSADAKKSLQQHTWPGNVRELRNLIERVAYLCPGDRIESKDLPFISRPTGDTWDEYADLTLAKATDQFQINHIKQAIDRARGNMSDAAATLGLHRPNLYRKMKLLEKNNGKVFPDV